MGLFCFWKREFPTSESYLLDLEKRFPNFEKVHFLILEMLFFPDLEILFPNLEKKTCGLKHLTVCRGRALALV